MLSVLLALLGMLGAFSIDTYIPAFADMAKSLSATPAQLQQTLSAYLFSFSFMSLFHGAISDSIGRRKVVLGGLVAFTLACMGCALSTTIGELIFFRGLQGLTAGAGIVVSRAIIRDMFAPSQAQKVMSQVTIFFGLAPAIAPMVGGWLLLQFEWQAIFWLLFGIGLLLILANFKFLPESLPPEKRQRLHVKHLLADYWKLGSDPRFLLMALASGVPFNGMFLYVLSAPVFLQGLGLEPQQFFWLFLINVGGLMVGAFLSGRLAGKIVPKRQIQIGFTVMLVVSMLNLLANLLFTPHVSWALIPISIYSLGWAMLMPVVTLLLLDLHPERRGMASSLQMSIGSLANALVAGVISPLVMHSTVMLAFTSLGLMCIGLFSWVLIRKKWPQIGQHIIHQ